jgi:hypothetical protein
MIYIRSNHSFFFETGMLTLLSELAWNKSLEKRGKLRIQNYRSLHFGYADVNI